VLSVKSAEAARRCSVACSGYFRWGSLTAVLFASALLVVPGFGLQPTVKAGNTQQGGHSKGKNGAAPADRDNGKGEKAEQNAYDFTLPGADGKDVPVSNFKGKYILIVNLGRKSTYGEQLQSLVKLNDAYKDKGLVVIGVPSNQFGLAEPGTPAEIQKAYTDAKIDFPVMAVSKITGDDELPLYGYLTKGKEAPPGGPVHWNYTKFIIDKNGKVMARLDPDVDPNSAEMKSTIEQVLDGTYKPKKAEGKPGAKPADDDDDDDD
jgi:glutathione peroxidase